MKLYYAPGSCSLASHIALNEIGATYDLIRVDLKTHTIADRGEDFYAINPNGYVPLLELDSGARFTETPALLQMIADMDKEHRLLPAANDEARWRVIEMIAYISTELPKNFSMFFNPNIPKDLPPTVKTTIEQRLQKLDNHLASQSYLTGNTFSIADIYAFVAIGWTNYVGMSIDQFAHIKAFTARIAQRPQVQAALKEEGLA